MAAKVSRRSSLSIMPSRFWSMTVKACGERGWGQMKPGWARGFSIAAPGRSDSGSPPADPLHPSEEWRRNSKPSSSLNRCTFRGRGEGGGEGGGFP